MSRSGLHGLLEDSPELRELERVTQIGRWLWEPSTGRLAWSKGLYDLYGVSPKSFQPTPARSARFSLAADLRKSCAIVRQALRSRAPFFDFQYRVRHPDGLIRTFQSRARVDYEGRGRPKRVYGTIQDITVRELYLESLERASTLLTALVRSAPLGILAMDPKGRITLWNPAMAALTGWKPDEVLARRSLPFRLGPDQRRRRGLVLKGRTLSVETDIAVKGGGARRIQRTSGPLRGADGRLLGVFSLVQDIEPRKRLEREVLESITRERRRLSQALHDGPIQLLVSAVLRLAELGKRAPDFLRGDLAALVRTLQKAMKEARAVATGLDPFTFGQGGLRSALSSLAADAQRSSRVRCSVRFDAPAPSDDELSRQLYYIAREAVHNAVRHGLPKRIWIRFARLGARRVLTVEDDGKGLPVKPAAGGMGQRIMAFRAAAVGGSVTFEPRRPRGTVVRCQLP